MVGAAHDPALVKVILDDLGRHGQIRISLHGPGQPVDVRRLERSDLVEPVPVELAERDDEGERLIQRRTRRRPEVAHAIPLERSARVRRPEGLAT